MIALLLALQLQGADIPLYEAPQSTAPIEVVTQAPVVVMNVTPEAN